MSANEPQRVSHANGASRRSGERESVWGRSRHDAPRTKMKHWLTAFAVFAVCTAAVHADVTIVQTTTIEGGMAAMGGQPMSPKTTNRIKGKKSRADIDAQVIQLSTIADLDANQVILLRPDQKTAQIIAPAAGGAVAKESGTSMPSTDSSMKPTGRSQVIDGIKCDEYTFTVSMNMGDMAPGVQMPPEALEAMKGVKMNMNGSLWLAKDVPGAAEYLAYQKASASSELGSIISRAAGMQMPGMDRLMKAMGGLNGIAYMTEMTMAVEGTGQFAEMMQQMGAMKITTKVTSITTDPIADDVFKIPDGYSVIKQ